ncbi:putative zinc-binding protein [Caldicoprobacter algeriensis]|uniref:putative zinc-binding protein n=1 Tax=Caldicoprobacter algeriensis TaxID=699281 RepID=UPI002079BE52|nr:putative zinc-binding protein [Caldicoprobacter algeriensis]MCM8900651.1 putative zinc-binding protein [Caldicoprobacter algeriensis]
MRLGILPCQGACNVGNMTSKVALKYVDNERINMVCALGLPLGIENIIKMAKINDKFIALNGCPIKCASKTLDKIGITEYEEIVLTSDFGIEKNKNFKDESNMDKVEQKVEEIIKSFFHDQI